MEQRRARLVAKLEELGEIAYQSTGRSGGRDIRIGAIVPGLGLPTVATFVYREIFRPTVDDLWDLVIYTYEYRAAGGGRRAYHLHDGRFHAHCVDPRKPERDHHYRAIEMDLFEAHDEFRALYVSGARIACGDLRLDLGQSANRDVS